MIKLPKYKKKITRLMDYNEFKQAIQDLPRSRQAFLSVLFFAGCRVSEALALTPNDINCTKDTIYVQFFRLKGSNQTDPIPLPREDALNWICHTAALLTPEGATERIFWYGRHTAYRLVKKCFPTLYPHYFRMNRIMKISDEFGDATVYSYVGITAGSIDHYRGKVDIKKVGKALQKEIAQ